MIYRARHRESRPSKTLQWIAGSAMTLVGVCILAALQTGSAATLDVEARPLQMWTLEADLAALTNSMTPGTSLAPEDVTEDPGASSGGDASLGDSTTSSSVPSAPSREASSSSDPTTSASSDGTASLTAQTPKTVSSEPTATPDIQE